MTHQEKALEQLHCDLGYRKLNPTWAKVEIVLGLLAVGIGLFLGTYTVGQPLTSDTWLSLSADSFYTERIFSDGGSSQSSVPIPQ